MKKLITVLLLGATLVSTVSYAYVTCSVRGPRGGVWTKSGYNKSAAINNALAVCSSRTGGPCYFIGGSCSWH